MLSVNPLVTRPQSHERWCRSLSLERTAAILDSAARTIGAARIGSITRLDGIGIPTASVVRSGPIGESISVNTGKGASELQARVGALAEALERYCAEPRGRIAIQTVAAVNIADAISLERLILPTDAKPNGLVDWCRGSTLKAVPAWVPANAVFFPYYPSPGAEQLFAANTTGLAVGASVEEALCFGLLECIERDAYSRAVAMATAGSGDRVPVLDTVSVRAHAGAEFAAVMSRGHEMLVRDLLCDTEVPCYLCTIHDGTLTHYGVAARTDAGEALRAAIQEAAQSRLTDLQGAREDLSDRTEGTVVDSWFLKAGNAQMVPVRGGIPASSATEVLAYLQERLRVLEPSINPIWVDLSLPNVSLAVVRAIAPGLEVWAYDPSRLGPRARSWLCVQQ